jgi:hypothetical protein
VNISNYPFYRVELEIFSSQLLSERTHHQDVQMSEFSLYGNVGYTSISLRNQPSKAFPQHRVPMTARVAFSSMMLWSKKVLRLAEVFLTFFFGGCSS